MHRGGMGSLIAPLKPEQLKKWREKFPPLHYPTGQTLFYEGHQPYGIYVVHSGTLVLKARKRSRAKKILISAGTAVGLDLIVRGQPYPCTAIIQDDVELSFISRMDLMKRLGKRDTLIAPIKAASGNGHEHRHVPSHSKDGDSE